MRIKAIVIVSMVLVFVAVPLLAQAATTYRATCNVPATQPPAMAMKYWGDLVTKKTNERFNFQYHWGGSLTKAGEELQAVRSGMANVGFYAMGYYPSLMVLNGVSYVVPFNPPDPRVLLRIYERLVRDVPELAAEIEQHNQKLMFYIPFASYEILSTKPVKTLADFKGLKVGAIGATMPKWFEAVGAVPISMPSPERYQALQTGIIGASCMGFAPHDPFKLTDIAKHSTTVNLGSVILAPVVLNTDDWKKLSPEDQKLFLEAGREAGQWIADKTMEEEAAIKAKWKGLGVAFYTLSASDKQAWAEKVKSLPYDWAETWDKKGIAATKTMDAYLKAAADVGHKYPVSFSKK